MIGRDPLVKSLNLAIEHRSRLWARCHRAGRFQARAHRGDVAKRQPGGEKVADLVDLSHGDVVEVAVAVRQAVGGQQANTVVVANRSGRRSRPFGKVANKHGVDSASVRLDIDISVNVDHQSMNLTHTFDTSTAVTSGASTTEPHAVLDALYRFGLGQDLRHQPGARELFESAFTPDAVLDFRPAAKVCGLEVPLMEGRQMIADIILSPATEIDTTHVVTNPRVSLKSASAQVTALVEAQHLPSDDHSRHALLKNFYAVDALHDGEQWRMRRVVIDCVWFTGDPQVIIGK